MLLIKIPENLNTGSEIVHSASTFLCLIMALLRHIPALYPVPSVYPFQVALLMLRETHTGAPPGPGVQELSGGGGGQGQTWAAGWGWGRRGHKEQIGALTLACDYKTQLS